MSGIVIKSTAKAGPIDATTLLSQLIAEELAVARDMAMALQGVIPWLARVEGAEGIERLEVPMPLEAHEDQYKLLLRQLATFCIWRQASTVSVVSLRLRPISKLYCAARLLQGQQEGTVSIDLKRDRWDGTAFGPLELHPEGYLGPELRDRFYLPALGCGLTERQVAECRRWFGPEGRYPPQLRAAAVPSWLASEQKRAWG